MAKRASDIKPVPGRTRKPLTISDKRREDGWIVAPEGIVRRDSSAIVKSPAVRRARDIAKRIVEG